MPPRSGAPVIRNESALAARFGQPLYQAPADTIRGLDPTAWPSPLQPVKPIAPEDTEPKAFQFWEGQNLTWTPRPDAEFTAWDLKALATYPLARICIENVKDAICDMGWSIQPRAMPGESSRDTAKRGQKDKVLQDITTFFESPDGELQWDEWLRPMLDDIVVIDAPTILKRATYNGTIAELRVMKGEMFSRYIDQNGWTPKPPSPAYAQNWWGIPLVDLTTDQLLYRPRNMVPRNTVSSQLYGMSPVEQLAGEIEIGIKRLAFVSAYYTDGSIPDVMQVVPPGTPPNIIAEAMTWMNSELAGRLARRRQWRLVQGFSKNDKPEQILFAKEKLLADLYDDLHIKKIAFGIGSSAQRLAKQMNRASAEQADDAAEAEGTAPYAQTIESMMNWIIKTWFRQPQYQFVIDTAKEPDFEKLATGLKIAVGSALMYPNEGRDKLGLDPDPEPNANKLGCITGSGFVTLEQTETAATTAAKAPKESLDGASNTNGSGKKQPEDDEDGGAPNKKVRVRPNGHEAPVAAASDRAPVISGGVGFAAGVTGSQPTGSIVISQLEKLSAGDNRVVIHPGRLAPQSILAKHELERALSTNFIEARRKVLRLLRKRARIATKGMSAPLAKASDDDRQADEIMEELAREWRAIAAAAVGSLQDAASAGTGAAVLQLDIDDEGLVGQLNEVARDWARDRAAELVGMKYDEDGALVTNPDAEWAITETTREKLRAIITDVFAEGKPSLRDLEDAIDDAGIFSDTRASMIARTEISRAQALSNLMGWQESGVVAEVDWLLSLLHDHDDECDVNALGSPYPVGSVPNFPAHPNCVCSLTIHRLRGEKK